MMFHWYGLLVGMGVVAGYAVTEHKAIKAGVSPSFLTGVLMALIIAGFAGARVWHLVTDFSLYQNKSWLDMIAVWQGGMSIVGALGAASITWYMYYIVCPQSRASLKKILDALAWGLPVGQVIGRLANYVNNELFGIPTTAPWGITIPVEYRPIQYQTSSLFHPLFAYEMLCMLLFLCFLLLITKRVAVQPAGRLFLWYLQWYACVRFFLDFLRIEVGGSGVLGYNQFVFLGVLLVIGAFQWKKYASHK